ncbi:uncharacterized protein GGS25DRAFT_524731 [Hypoxylon fragiforme]|uniref:uncharacterized protein n=1 Tax=Hypoxylon fragiforme TaxID=63214 RepID=UPI0020C5BA88|nr:uncharacterized protein GGS25DRAFT_524731 [Hypoxylon fragiforme]KAI2605214.1 hypothetical protein GGS25DRAFT_524731 [Hypoxylon fragiforme]
MANDANPPPGMGKNPYWPPDEYEFEDVERYHGGGFFPITIWPLLDHGRYCVVHKLGNGHFSTIWLAQDLHENRHVDLQIPTVDQYDVCREEEVLRAFWKHVGKSDVGYVSSISDIHTSNIGYECIEFTDEVLDSIVPPACHIVLPVSEQRPPYLVSREEWESERHLAQDFEGPIIPQIFDFGCSFFITEKGPPKRHLSELR